MRRTSIRATPFRLIFAGALVAFGAACSSSEAELDCDNDDPPPMVTAPDTALIRSQVKLEARARFGADGAAEAVSNLATAAFVDSTRVERVNRSVNDQKFSMTCAGLTGAPVDQCREPYQDPECIRVQLEVDELQITGVPGGLSLEKKGTGTYVNNEAPDPLFGDEELGVAVTVSKAGDPAYFQSYAQKLAPPPQLVIEEPKPGQAVGAHDLQVCWTGKGADVIEIAIQIERADPDAPADTDKVVCLVKDDGCHTVPAAAFDWLYLGQLAPDDLFKVSISRERTAVEVLDDKTAAELKAAYQIELLLPQE